MLAVRFTNLVRNPDDKKEISKIRNSLIAAAVVFFIPVIVNALCAMIGSNSSFTTCWNSIDTKTNMGTALYLDDGDQEEEYIRILNSQEQYENSKSNKTNENNKTNINKYSNQREALLASLEKMSNEVKRETKNGIV